MSPVLIILAVIVVLALYVIGIYNTLIVLKNRIAEALSSIGIQLKRKVDLIPNLIETVKGYASHEKSVFEGVTKARTAVMSATEKGDIGAELAANNQLTGALKTLFAVAEAYPDLKANISFLDLQQQLTDTEDKIAYSRQFFNSNVLEYNAKVQMFPNNLLVGLFGFKAEKYFETTDEEQKNVKVQF
jgi:LemA protein